MAFCEEAPGQLFILHGFTVIQRLFCLLKKYVKHLMKNTLQTNISKRLLHASSQQLKEVVDLCNCLSCTSVATVSECIHTTLMIWHLLNNLLNLFLFNRVSSPFLCKGTLVFMLLVLYKNLLPTAL